MYQKSSHFIIKQNLFISFTDFILYSVYFNTFIEKQCKVTTFLFSNTIFFSFFL